jgi:predicted deacylase
MEIGGTSVRAGRRGEIELPVAKLVTGSPLSMPVLVLHGASDGPTIWINGAIHGDELNGTEIIRRVIAEIDPKTLSGTILAVPVVNLPGFVAGSRYLPDRRDLNRLFPGSARGSLGSRIARIFMTEIVARSSVGIDFHTGSGHRTNVPQIRADLDDPETLDLASAFGAPVMMHAATRDGSLRQAGAEAGATVLLYEAGEAWRLDDEAIETGVAGTRNVLRALGMIKAPRTKGRAKARKKPITCRGSKWIRARRSGIALVLVKPGDKVAKGQTIGQIHDTFGRRLSQDKATTAGIVVGLNLDPIVNQGDALVHIAQPEST